MMSSDTLGHPAGARSITRYLGGAGLALWALVMALRPDPGFSAPWVWMALFWAVQIAVGLAVLQSVLYLMTRSRSGWRWPLWLLVVGSGVLGSAALTPLYWLIGEGLMEQVIGFTPTIDGADDLEEPAPFGLDTLMAEFGDIVGPVTTAWALISWPRLQGLLPPLVAAPRSLASAPVSLAPVSAMSALPAPQAPSALGPPPGPFDSSGPPTRAAPRERPQPTRPAWRATLPSELGDDLVTVASELQYLRVWTTRGCALVLGSLQEVEASEGNAGIRVHRSWWVHAHHVRGVRRRGDSVVCEMSDGREVPVSRRRKADVLSRFGDTARYDRTVAARPAPADEPDQKVRRNPI